MTWEEVRDGLEAKKGQIVSTSCLGGVFPPDLAVGKVVKVETDKYCLTKKAYIEPAADFYDSRSCT
ncbi:rod shape-determining protein MreC [Niallia taxi]|nr:rod shape-determining protein MreC [Niallia taxi]MDE5052250.1 rod shape-determining protein MreC [Niallia taxi]